MRIHFLHAGLLEPLETVVPFFRSRPGYLIRTGLRENTQVGSGSWRALKRNGMPSFIRGLGWRPGNTAFRQLGL